MTGSHTSRVKKQDDTSKKKTSATVKEKKSAGAKKGKQSGDNKKAAKEEKEEKPGKKNLEWVKNPAWTWAIVTYLTNHPEFRARLFSDSTSDAAKEGRKKLVGKESKANLHSTLAKAVFENDPEQAAGFQQDPARYATSVETRFRRIKTEYQGHVKLVGNTGAGVRKEELEPGSNLESLRKKIYAEFPWFDELHAFWKDLPSYNPIGVATSTPGTDHASDAVTAFEPTPQQIKASEEGEGDDGVQDENDGRKKKRAESEISGEGGDTDDDELKIDSEDDEPEDKKPKAKDEKGRAPTGRDLGLAKSNAGRAKAPTHRTAQDKIHDFRIQQGEHVERKREMAHELALEESRRKWAKYKFKLKQAELENSTKAQDAQAERAARQEDFRLQIQLLQAQAEMAHAQGAAGPLMTQAPHPESPCLPQLSDAASMPLNQLLQEGTYQDSFGFSGSSSPLQF